MNIDQVNSVSGAFEEDIKSVTNLKELEELRIKYLSRNGLVSTLFEKLKEVPKEEKPAFGNKLNPIYLIRKRDEMKNVVAMTIVIPGLSSDQCNALP